MTPVRHYKFNFHLSVQFSKIERVEIPIARLIAIVREVIRLRLFRQQLEEQFRENHRQISRASGIFRFESRRGERERVVFTIALPSSLLPAIIISPMLRSRGI